jgi:hypothetical protein
MVSGAAGRPGSSLLIACLAQSFGRVARLRSHQSAVLPQFRHCA